MKRIKKLEIRIEFCGQCPYCEYDSNYGISYNSGYDCKMGLGRLSEDIGSEREYMGAFPVPENCPLPDLTITEERKNKLERIVK